MGAIRQGEWVFASILCKGHRYSSALCLEASTDYQQSNNWVKIKRFGIANQLSGKLSAP
jgi:hypothetical protein